MKKFISMLLVIGLLLSTITITFADSTTVTVVADEGWTNATYDATTGLLTNVDGGYSFIWEPSTGTLKYGGSTITTTKVIIPASINGVTVKKMGSYIMNGAKCTSSSVTELIVSKGITEIGTNSFYSESKLQKVTLPDGIKTINGSAFNSCTGLIQINLPDSIETIGNNCLASCTILESIDLPANLTSLGSQAFSNCKKLSSVAFRGNKLTTLKSKTFNLCPLKSIEIPDSITTLESAVFTSNKFTDIVIPKGVTQISSQLFSSCSNLKTVTFKGNITSIGAKAFYGNKVLELIKFEGDTAPTEIDSTTFESANGTFTVSYPSRGTGYDSAFRALFDGLNVTFSTTSGRPEASGVSLKGDTILGSTLTGYYSQYYDVNGDIEDGSTYSWKRSTDPMFVQNIETITTGTIKSGETASYTTTTDDVGSYIQFSVTPRNKAEFDNEGDEVGATTEFVIREPKTIPTVKLLSPVDGEAIGVANVAPLLVDATCDLATITKVEYYANDTLVSTSTEEPYSGEWANHPEGYYKVFARAYNNLGEYGDSPIHTVTVNESDPILMSSLFGNDMVLQRRKPVAIYGNAEQSENTITVKFNGQEKTGNIVGGKFRIMLDSMEAGGPYTLEIIAGRSGYVKTFTNVMVGEVWVCSGQSNMAVNGGSQASGDYPNIRLFKQSSSTASYEMDDVKDGSWNICTKAFSSRYSAVSFYFAEKLHNDLDVPVGILLGAISDTRIVKWIPYDYLASDADIGVYAKGQSGDSTLYNGMIAPFTPFTVNGFVWYQGEGDHLFGHIYEKNLTSLVKSWREAWGDNNLPFLFVQLPNFNYADNTTVEYVREAQLNTFKNLNNMGMAVTLDIGNNNNVHPGNKDITAHRLALFAEKYLGVLDDDEVYCSPIYNNYEIKDNKIIITFDHVGTGLKTKDGNMPSSFTICGADEVFVDAQANIISNNQVEVWADSVPNPVAVRYAWLDIPPVNLVNSSDLPASPFRTDKFKKVTNVAPIVELVSPAKGESFVEGSSITLVANAYDSTGEVTKVDFYSNGVFLGSDNTAPYTYTIDDIQNGIYAFSATATDDEGATNTTSGSIVATPQPYETIVGNATYQPINYNQDNFENYEYNYNGNVAPTSLTGKLLLNGARVFATDSPQASGAKSMMITTNGTAQSPTITDTSYSGTYYKLKTKVLFDSYDAERIISLNKNGTSAKNEILRFAADGTISISQPYSKIVDRYQLNTWYDIDITVNTITNRLNIKVNDKVYVENKVIKSFDIINGISIEHIATTNNSTTTYFENMHYGAYQASVIIPFECDVKYTDADDKTITSIGNNKIIKAVSTYKNGKKDDSAVLILAAYSGNKLVNISIGETKQLDAIGDTVTINNTGIDNITSVRAFVLNNPDDIIPIETFQAIN